MDSRAGLAGEVAVGFFYDSLKFPLKNWSTEAEKRNQYFTKDSQEDESASDLNDKLHNWTRLNQISAAYPSIYSIARTPFRDMSWKMLVHDRDLNSPTSLPCHRNDVRPSDTELSIACK